MNYFQEQILQQKMVMTQEMMQSLEILQVSAVELKSIIDREHEENPLLEIIETNEEKNDEYKKSESVEDENYYEEESYISGENYSSEDEGTNDFYSNIASREPDIIKNFYVDLKNELKESLEKEIADYIISGIDEKGFFSEAADEAVLSVKKILGIEITLEKFEKVRAMIMKFDNRGIASKNISEYLAIKAENFRTKQLQEIGKRIFIECFEEFSRKKVKEISKKLGVKEELLKEIYCEVSKLEPFPLRGYENKGEASSMMVPDVIVKEENGEFEVYLNDKFLPEIKLNNEYYKMLSQDKKAVEYLKEKAMRVRSLEKSIEQRNMTIYRVASKIVEKQKEFFKKGIGYMKPMILNEVGDELSLHESTISRVVNGKYMQTDRGVFEFKYFFSGRVETESGEDMSMIAVQKLIKEIVEKEDKKLPFTDKEICEILVRKGIKISQRTVSNYREAMEILPTYLRKEL